jgi:hypothetical protein
VTTFWFAPKGFPDRYLAHRSSGSRRHQASPRSRFTTGTSHHPAGHCALHGQRIASASAQEATMLTTSASHPDPIHHPPCEVTLQAFFANLDAAAVAPDPVRLADLQPQAQRAISAWIDNPGEPDDTDAAPDWTEEDVVHLHWRLLLELRRLPDPETPLEEKLDTLAWALTDPSFDGRPFSFASCLRVVGTSPMSPAPYFGLIEVDVIRGWLQSHSREWIGTTIARYPEWVRMLIQQQPDWVAKQLAKNPQWINEQIKARQSVPQIELFAAATSGH